MEEAFCLEEGLQVAREVISESMPKDRLPKWKWPAIVTDSESIIYATRMTLGVVMHRIWADSNGGKRLRGYSSREIMAANSCTMPKTHQIFWMNPPETHWAKMDNRLASLDAYLTINAAKFFAKAKLMPQPVLSVELQHWQAVYSKEGFSWVQPNTATSYSELLEVIRTVRTGFKYWFAVIIRVEKWRKTHEKLESATRTSLGEDG